MLNLVSFILHNVSPVDDTGETVPEEISEVVSEIPSDDYQEEESASDIQEEESASDFPEEESSSEVDSSEYTSQVVVDNQVSSYSPQLDTLIGVGLFLIVIVLSFMIYKELCKLFDC